MSVETGVTDHHLLIFSFSKTFFTKMQPNKLHYRKYKLFYKIVLLKYVPNLPGKKSYTEWENHFLRVLNKHAPLNSKVIRENNKPFATKTYAKMLGHHAKICIKEKNIH